METSENILTELKSISPAVATIGTENVYRVPAGYFDHLPELILERVTAVVQLGNKDVPYALPAGYFDSLADNILNKIKAEEVLSVEEELNQLAPILNTISKKPVYTVPEGYFESLEITIPMTVAKPGARIFGLGKVRKAFQYAVVACAAGVLMVGAYFYTSNDSSDSMVINYDSALKMDVTEELAELNEQEITAYLDETPGVGYTVSAGPEEVNIEEYLQTASDEEIREYLNETSTPGERAGS